MNIILINFDFLFFLHFLNFVNFREHEIAFKKKLKVLIGWIGVHFYSVINNLIEQNFLILKFYQKHLSSKLI